MSDEIRATISEREATLRCEDYLRYELKYSEERIRNCLAQIKNAQNVDAGQNASANPIVPQSDSIPVNLGDNPDQNIPRVPADHIDENIIPTSQGSNNPLRK